MRWSLSLALCLLLGSGQAYAQPVEGSAEPTVVYFVRHGEVELTPPNFPLNAQGQRRAVAFARTVTDVPFTHLFSSHTTRARQMVDAIAERRQLPIRQLPEPGSAIDGAVVNDRTPSRVATPLLIEAVRALPPGSTALVGVNSDNLFAILHGLGVPLASAERPCDTRSSCVPCLTNQCFPERYDGLWVLVLDPHGTPPKLLELRYGEAEPH
jgi:hypothetical protein